MSIITIKYQHIIFSMTMINIKYHHNDIKYDYD